MELLRVSKFKNQLRALITEARDLREREHCATEQIHLLIQKQKQTEEESDKKFQELQAELALSDELRQKLERKVKYLENDNALLENKQKELKGTIDCLLQSRENFVSLYEDSTCEMKRSIEKKDRKLAVLSEKIHNHLSLFESIEKEAVSVKQVVDNVQQLVNEKEEVVSGLKRKMEKVSTFEKEYVEKICFLENKLKNNQDELQRRDTVISDLEGQLEAAKIINNSQPRIEELQNALSIKEVVIQNLIAEKKALHFEVRSLDIILKKIQDTIMHLNTEDKKAFSSVLEGQEECATMRTENDRIDDKVQKSREHSPCKDPGRGAEENTASPPCLEYNPVNNLLRENYNSCVSEFACSPPHSAYSDPQSTANVLNVSAKRMKGNSTSLVYQLDSESSTTEAEAEAEVEASTDRGARV